MRVLIVEDDPEKANAIAQAVEAAGVDSEGIFVVPDSMGAKSTLKSSDSFQLFIVDIRIPKRFGEGTSAVGGPELLKWFMRRNDCPPEAVLAVTGFDLEKNVEAILDDLGVTQVRYRLGEDKWKRVVQGVVKSVLRRLSDFGTRENYVKRADFYFQTTVDIEFSALTRAFGDEDQRLLLCGETWLQYNINIDKKQKLVVISQASQMGMPAAAALATKAIQLWKPRNMWMVGICAGVLGESLFGDIIVPDPVWDLGSGKLREGGVLHPDPRPVELRDAVRSHILHYRNLAPLEDWYKAWPARTPPNKPRVLCKPSASGAAVLADGATVNLAQSHNRKLASIDMEAYGFYYAVAHSGLDPCPRFASIKSVVDYANKEKDDDYQPFGADIAAKFAKWLAYQKWS